MMNYVVKYSIANCVFGTMTEAQLKADTAYIGIFSLSAKGMYEIDFEDIDIVASIIGAITVRSGLGGGIGFPRRESALEILRNDHNDLIKAFIDTITEKNIVLFDDGEKYAPVMIEIVLQTMKEAGKEVAVTSVIPPRFEGKVRRKTLDVSWREIESMADEAILQDLSYICDSPMSMSELQTLRRHESLKTIADRWKSVDIQ